MKKRHLKKLVRHMQIHSGYQENGYMQMTTEQKARYDRIAGRVSPLYDQLDDNQKQRYDEVYAQ